MFSLIKLILDNYQNIRRQIFITEVITGLVFENYNIEINSTYFSVCNGNDGEILEYYYRPALNHIDNTIKRIKGLDQYININDSFCYIYRDDRLPIISRYVTINSDSFNNKANFMKENNMCSISTTLKTTTHTYENKPVYSKHNIFDYNDNNIIVLLNDNILINLARILYFNDFINKAKKVWDRNTEFINKYKINLT